MILLIIQYHRLDSHDFIFFFNDTATTEIYTLSLHDALPISMALVSEERAKNGWDFLDQCPQARFPLAQFGVQCGIGILDRKSTRLNSSHGYISYAVFCLKKKNNISTHQC